MLLSNTDIVCYRALGAIVIEPFREDLLSNVSYDCRLGSTVARYKNDHRMVDLSDESPEDMFELESAERNMLQNGTRGFHLAPGERVLAHTMEIAGGRQITCPDCEGRGCPMCDANGAIAVTTNMRATSTAGRIGLSVAQCAGVGDCGFLNVWCLELQNHAPRALWLPVGAVICQVTFHKITPPLDGTGYDVVGRYRQQYTDPAEVLNKWDPQTMLPRRLKVR